MCVEVCVAACEMPGNMQTQKRSVLLALLETRKSYAKKGTTEMWGAGVDMGSTTVFLTQNNFLSYPCDRPFAGYLLTCSVISRTTVVFSLNHGASSPPLQWVLKHSTLN